jgi:hypothetical protein
MEPFAAYAVDIIGRIDGKEAAFFGSDNALGFRYGEVPRKWGKCLFHPPPQWAAVLVGGYCPGGTAVLS